MPTIAHYEIYTLEESGWVLHARYVSTEKARAIDEARALDAELGRPTKVLRESYDIDANRYAEQTVFLSPKAAEARKQGRYRPPAAGGGGAGWAGAGAGVGVGVGTVSGGLRPNAQIPPGFEAFGADQGPRPAASRFGAPTHAKSTSDLVARVMFVIIASLVIATSGTALIPVLVGMLRGFGLVLSGAALSKTLFAVFMVLFLASGFFLTLRVVPLQGVRTAAQTPKSRRSSAGGARSGASAAEAADPAAPGASGEAAGTAGDAPIAEASAPTTDPAADQGGQAERGRQKDSEKGKDKERDKAAERDRQKKQKKDKDGNARETGGEEPAESRKDGQAAGAEADDAADETAGPEAADAEPAAEPASPAFEAGRSAVMTFLGGYVTALKTIRPRLDTYNRFGINLYLAGVCEVQAKKENMVPADFSRLLRETVEIMGTRAAQAESFVKKLDTYLQETRYAEMVQHGREAMMLNNSGKAEPFANLGMVLEDWNMPKTQEVSRNTIAIVFTDMVGSTDLTSQHGDVKAQQILRAHNSAVRAALARFGGREIKHTGDGIMATFDVVPDAVRGMIDVLQAVRSHNMVQPEIPLRIRIGINAGEPISAENDYYGLAVTVAARVCAQAGMDRILVSQIVRDLCEGSDLEFADRGTAVLKGLKEPQRLHEAVWEGMPPETAESSAAAAGMSGGVTDDRDAAGDGDGDGDGEGADAAAAEGAHPDGAAKPPASEADHRSAAAQAAAAAEAAVRAAGWAEGAGYDPEADGWVERPSGETAADGRTSS